ncbi:MAG: PQQ-binding-like beta-propeller repeat protein [bacterium]
MTASYTASRQPHRPRFPLFRTLLAIVALLASGCLSSIEPPAAQPEGQIRLFGRGFGNMQRGSYVSFTEGGGTAVEVRTVEAWTDRQIVLSVPPGVGSCDVRVHVDLSLVGMQVSEPVYLQVKAAGLPSEPYGYEVPVQADSPWPSFRRDRRNTGRSPIAGVYAGGWPWAFETAKGIFSTPVIDRDGTVYVGSADHNFYAVRPDGTEKWRFETGELIDSAATIRRFDPENGYSKVVFLSGDGNVYCLRADAAVSRPEDRLLWTFQATVSPGPGYNNWWEGNVVMGFDGTLYAGNTNWNYYAFSEEGEFRWSYTTGNNCWSAAAFADDGTIYWGSLDVMVHAVRPDGAPRWQTPTLGFVASSAAIGSDGTVYIGSFDSSLYALHPAEGKVLWQLPTMDHIYSSPALGVDDAGQTAVIYFGSADGTVYAVSPQGELLWTYDTGDTIRSSPAVGPAPPGEDREIVYVGCGNGKLYALNGDDGTRRWSFDTTPEDPELRDRNDLNGSPALGEQGVCIGGEHGFLWFVPYDYCLHAEDSRCETDPGEAFEDDLVGVYYVTSGGTTETQDPPTIPAATILTERLVVREAGETVDAAVCSDPALCPSGALDLDLWPPVPWRAEPSADGHFVHVIPDGFLEPGGLYHLLLDGEHLTGGLRIGNLVIGGSPTGSFSEYMEVRVEDSAADRIPLHVSESEVTALEWKRLSVPLPPMLPSLNQIGFDSYHWILGTLEATEPDAVNEGRLLLWAVGGTFDERGVLVPDPATDFTFPLSGRYKKDFFILSNEDFLMEVTGVPITFDLFQLRGGLGPDLRVRPGATAYAQAECLSIPTYGPLFAVAGLCNNVAGKLVALGTYITRPYDDRGAANRRPAGISVSSVSYTAPTSSQAGVLSAAFALEAGATYPVSEHLAAVILVDPLEVEAVGIDYHANLSVQSDPAGNLAGVSLTIPAGTVVPESSKAVVILDVFPFHETPLSALNP